MRQQTTIACEQDGDNSLGGMKESNDERWMNEKEGKRYVYTDDILNYEAQQTGVEMKRQKESIKRINMSFFSFLFFSY